MAPSMRAQGGPPHACSAAQPASCRPAAQPAAGPKQLVQRSRVCFRAVSRASNGAIRRRLRRGFRGAHRLITAAEQGSPITIDAAEGPAVLTSTAAERSTAPPKPSASCEEPMHGRRLGPQGGGPRGDHGDTGPLLFRRLLEREEAAAALPRPRHSSLPSPVRWGLARSWQVREGTVSKRRARRLLHASWHMRAVPLCRRAAPQPAAAAGANLDRSLGGAGTPLAHTARRCWHGSRCSPCLSPAARRPSQRASSPSVPSGGAFCRAAAMRAPEE